MYDLNLAMRIKRMRRRTTTHIIRLKKLITYSILYMKKFHNSNSLKALRLIPEQICVITEQIWVIAEEICVITKQICVIIEQICVIRKQICIITEQMCVITKQIFVIREKICVITEQMFVIAELIWVIMQCKFLLSHFGRNNTPRLCSLLISTEYIIFSPMTSNTFQFEF